MVNPGNPLAGTKIEVTTPPESITAVVFVTGPPPRLEIVTAGFVAYPLPPLRTEMKFRLVPSALTAVAALDAARTGKGLAFVCPWLGTR